MAKDTRLVNIYIKIHNKDTLTMEDLRYLSKYDPECFEKTCKNIVYKMPETKAILQPEQDGGKAQKEAPPMESLPPDPQTIEAALENLKRMEMKELPIEKVNVDTVKDLLGNLYMELLFPHNDRERFFNMKDTEELSYFNEQA